MKTVLLLFIVFIGENLTAQEWQYIATSSDGTEYYFKPNSSKTGWIKQVSAKTDYFPKELKGQKKTINGYNICLWKFDCDEKQIGLIQKNTYSSNGEVVDSIIIKDYNIEMLYVVPDSTGERLLKAFCFN
jgi:hypothetical protein